MHAGTHLPSTKSTTSLSPACHKLHVTLQDLAFGKVFTDHMLLVGWHLLQILGVYTSCASWGWA